MSTSRVWLLCAAFALAACDGADGGTADTGGVADVGGGDAGGDAGLVDAGGDAGSDVALSDVAADALADGGADGSVDATPDAGPDAGPDAAGPDTDSTNTPDTDAGPVPVPCSACEHEDDCRDEPCSTEGEACSVAPYCTDFQGECVCTDGAWECTATDCPVECEGDAPACCTGGHTVSAECAPWGWDCGDGTPGACPGACDDPPPAGWCLVACEGRAILDPVCTAELGWHCPDGSIPPGACCDAPLVYTAAGCATCGEASAGLQAAIGAAVAAYGDCAEDADCTGVFADTACQGTCEVPVSKAGEADFLAALQSASVAYCQDYVQQCGYSSPSCAPVTPVCKAGACALELTPP